MERDFNFDTPFVSSVASFHTASGRCTAFLVSPDVAMTNAHCVLDKRTGQVKDITKMKLLFEHIEKSTEIGVASIHSNPDYLELGDSSSDFEDYTNCGNDWAILKLQRKTDFKFHQPLEIALNAKPVNVATAGYPGDLYNGQVMTAHWGCTRRTVPTDDGISYFCHSYRGASGSPIIDVTPKSDSWGKLVGINACGPKDNDNYNIGTSVAKFYGIVKQFI